MDTNKCSDSRPFVSIRGFLLRLWLRLCRAMFFRGYSIGSTVPVVNPIYA
jgi:hypothetical protein